MKGYIVLGAAFSGMGILAAAPWTNIAAVLGTIGGIAGLVSWWQMRDFTAEFRELVQGQTDEVDTLVSDANDALEQMPHDSD